MLILFGSTTRDGFEHMVAYTAPVFWLFMLLVALSIIVFRMREPGRELPFKVPLYPLPPLILAAACAWMFYSALLYAGWGSIMGVVVLAIGLPLMFLQRELQSPEAKMRTAKSSPGPRRLIAALVLLLGCTPAAAQGVADFYRGKEVRLIVSASTGGGYDTYGRTVARHLGEHIPGKPTVVPQNMPAAGGLGAANHTYNVAQGRHRHHAVPEHGAAGAVLREQAGAVRRRAIRLARHPDHRSGALHALARVEDQDTQGRADAGIRCRRRRRGFDAGVLRPRVAARPAAALPGIKDVKPQVFAGLYPVEANQYEALRDALNKLKLNDASLHFEPRCRRRWVSASAAAFSGCSTWISCRSGWNANIDMDLITTAPTVIYQVLSRDGTLLEIENPSKLPDLSKVEEIREPMITATILMPQEYVGPVLTLCTERRGTQKNMQYLGRQVMLTYEFRWPKW